MKKETLYIIIGAIYFGLISCGGQINNPKTKNTVDSLSQNVDSMTSKVDIKKRDVLVKKYDLMNFPNSGKRVFMTVQEFFDGNADPGSIAPNLSYKPRMSVYYSIFDKISKQENVTAVLVEINE